MKYHKLIAGETTGTYVMESPVTEADILKMAQQLAMSRLSKGRALTEPKQVFSHLQTLLQYHEYEVFALLLLDTKHRVIGISAGSSQDRSRAQRRGRNSGSQSSLRRPGAQPSRSHVDHHPQERPQYGRHPNIGSCCRGPRRLRVVG